METTEIEHWNITIKGRVQGVGYRYSAREAAKTFKVKGFVKNLPNHDVYIEAEGTKQQLEDFIKWCHEGPPHARVEHVTFFKGTLLNFKDFDIGH